MRLTGEAYGSPWAPTAYVGILEGPDLRDSVQVMLSRNLPTDPLARVEYRVFSSGKLESEGSLLEIDSRTPVEVRLEFHTGKVRLTVNEKVTDAFSTQLKLVKRYAAVSSGSAEIKFAP